MIYRLWLSLLLLAILSPGPLYPKENKKDIQLQSIAFNLFEEKEKLQVLRSRVKEKNMAGALSDEHPLALYSLLDSLDKIVTLCNYEYEIMELAPRIKDPYKPKYYQRRKKQILSTIDEIRAELNTIDMLFKETPRGAIVNLADETKKSIQSVLALMEYGLKILQPD